MLGDSTCVCVNLPLALIKPQQNVFCPGMLRHFMSKNRVSVSLRYEVSIYKSWEKVELQGLMVRERCLLS